MSITTLSISKDVFKAAVEDNSGKLKEEAKHAGESFIAFAQKLTEAANVSDFGPHVEFSVIPIAMADESAGEVDFVLQYIKKDHAKSTAANRNALPGKNDLDEEPIKAVDAALLDYSFGVYMGPHYIKTPALNRRGSSEFVPLEQAPGAELGVKLERKEQFGDLTPIDVLGQETNFLFTWIYNKLPNEQDRAKFLENCQDLHLVPQESDFGFQMHREEPQVAVH